VPCLPKPCAKLFDEARLADAGFADDRHELSFAGASAFPAAVDHTKVLRTADERREEPRALPPASPAHAQNAIERNWRRRALELMRAPVLNEEQAGDLPLDGRSDQYGSWLGSGLDACGDIRRLPEYLTGGIDDDWAGFQPDASDKLRDRRRGVPRVKFAERPMNGERRAHCALGVVLLRLRVAEQGHEPVAEFLQHMPAKRGHRR